MELLATTIAEIRDNYVLIQLPNQQNVRIPINILTDKKGRGVSPSRLRLLDPVKLKYNEDGAISHAVWKFCEKYLLKGIEELKILPIQKKLLSVKYESYRRISGDCSFFKAVSVCILENLFRPDVGEHLKEHLKGLLLRMKQEVITDLYNKIEIVEELIDLIGNDHRFTDHNIVINNCLSIKQFKHALGIFSKLLLHYSIFLDSQTNEIGYIVYKQNETFNEIMNCDSDLEEVYYKYLANILKVNLSIVLTMHNFALREYKEGNLGDFHIYEYASRYYPLITRKQSIIYCSRESEITEYREFINSFQKDPLSESLYQEKERLKQENQDLKHSLNLALEIINKAETTIDPNKVNQLYQNLKNLDINRGNQ